MLTKKIEEVYLSSIFIFIISMYSTKQGLIGIDSIGHGCTRVHYLKASNLTLGVCHMVQIRQHLGQGLRRKVSSHIHDGLCLISYIGSRMMGLWGEIVTLRIISSNVITQMFISILCPPKHVTELRERKSETCSIIKRVPIIIGYIFHELEHTDL